MSYNFSSGSRFCEGKAETELEILWERIQVEHRKMDSLRKDRSTGRSRSVLINGLLTGQARRLGPSAGDTTGHHRYGALRAYAL
ncbi:hypothetical protein M514_00583 [Trichuris suis]|uniref:Uncharacterized protein n=1 Tax=Trichuris suis TaxID=68888 RepID=A0A085MVJ4_9BILA|nr:hypothetical protein M514_00583 [Trichuris suis]